MPATNSPMKLPRDCPDLVRAGAATLDALGAKLRNVASANADATELWLSVRDLEGLAGRLAESTDWEWRHGVADNFITPQDLAVLDELCTQRGVGPLRLPDEHLVALIRLRRFLDQYGNRAFELDDPAA